MDKKQVYVKNTTTNTNVDISNANYILCDYVFTNYNTFISQHPASFIEHGKFAKYINSDSIYTTDVLFVDLYRCVITQEEGLFKLSFTEVATIAALTSTGYEHCTENDTWYYNGTVITVHEIAEEEEGALYYDTINKILYIYKESKYAWKKVITNITKTYVTIPIDNWTTVTDTDSATYYTRDITVFGMTADYVGSRSYDYVRPNPYTVANEEAIKETAMLIEDIISGDGIITVYASAIPTTAITIVLYGVGG